MAFRGEHEAIIQVIRSAYSTLYDVMIFWRADDFLIAAFAVTPRAFPGGKLFTTEDRKRDL